jgi:membrane protein implicated in regulation of membrane protease activity
MILWKPLQRMKAKQRQSGYSNVVGETAVVAAGGVNRKTGGNVTWSGTVMKAELCRSCTADHLDEGAQTIITDVRGATLVIREKA